MSFKPIDPDATIGVVSVLDEAIDETTEKYAEFFNRPDDDRSIALKTPWLWRDYLVSKSGMKIAEFIIGTIPSSTMNYISDTFSASHNQLTWEAFVAGLVDIKDGPCMEVTDEGGRPKYVVPKFNGKVDPKWLSKIFIRNHRAVALEIGLHAWRWQQFEEEDARP